MARPKTGKPPKKNLTLTVDEETREQLELLSQYRQQSISAMVTEWVNKEVRELQQEYIDVNEVEITLLTVEEARSLPKEVTNRGCQWWLRSPCSDRPDAAYIYNVGDASVYGYFVQAHYVGVRPAFKIANLKSSRLNKILVGKTWCTVIAPGLALADRTVCIHRYDAESNNWETSELKAFIESDKFKAML